MSKMTCLCGEIIRNNQVPCPTEGWLIRDQDQEDYHADASRDISAFFDAARGGRREAWILKYFSAKYPADTGDEEIVQDILSYRSQAFLSVAECERCGRLWVQREPEVNSYRSYAPDEPGYAEALRSRQAERGTDAEGGAGGNE